MDRHQDAAFLHHAFVTLGFVFGDAHPHQRSDEPADHAARADTGQSGPVMLFLQPRDIGDQRGFSRLDAAVIGVGRLRPALAGPAGIVQQGADILPSVPRMVFARQQVISTLLQQRWRGLARGMPGVECDRAACEREQRQPRPPGRRER